MTNVNLQRFGKINKIQSSSLKRMQMKMDLIIEIHKTGMIITIEYWPSRYTLAVKEKNMFCYFFRYLFCYFFCYLFCYLFYYLFYYWIVFNDLFIEISWNHFLSKSQCIEGVD